jgi:hypothetical protein
MNTALNLLLLSIVVLAPFGLVAALASRSRGNGSLRWYLDQYRFTTPMVGRLLEGRDADTRRMGHDLDAIRTRFEQQPAWPTSGARADSR